MKADENDESNTRQITIKVKWKESSANKNPASLSFNIALKFEQATGNNSENVELPTIPEITGPTISEYPKVYKASSDYPESYVVTLNSDADLSFIGMSSTYKFGDKVTINKEGYPSGAYYKVIAAFNPSAGEEQWLLIHENGNYIIGFMSADYFKDFINGTSDLGILFTSQ